jgi:hypothetical protein
MIKPTYFFARPRGGAKDPLEGKFTSSKPPNLQAGAEAAIPLKTLAGLYWFVELAAEHKALSTEEIAVAMDSGRRARAISGTFPTREEAEQSLERYREMIMNHDDE